MGICAIQHRQVTGRYTSNFKFFVCDITSKYNKIKQLRTTEIDSSSVFSIICFLYYIIMIYIIGLVMGICIETSYKTKDSFLSTSENILPLDSSMSRELINICLLTIIYNVPKLVKFYHLKVKHSVLSIFKCKIVQYTYNNNNNNNNNKILFTTTQYNNIIR